MIITKHTHNQGSFDNQVLSELPIGETVTIVGISDKDRLSEIKTVIKNLKKTNPELQFELIKHLDNSGKIIKITITKWLKKN